ncbi:MAG: methyl-accepting chemotaxis protein [Rhodospirillum sp.]|nr:methyl-accepting chemotaxis protein [Rhodospirillum sp.]MCF8487539.1 methyl-accepting chemotaxis protein [Rhodospirillum sp.]MCF8499022.1 methyl-accepting chemotaxis protein [Rhodospirillum sp.]
MSLLGHLRIRTKLALLLALFALGMSATLAINANRTWNNMYTDRVEKLKAVVGMATSYAKDLETRVQKGDLTRDQAFERLHDIVHTMRFDGGKGFITVLRTDGLVLSHGARPDREGAFAPAKNAEGRPIKDLMGDVLKTGDSGTIWFDGTKPGEAEMQPKVSYIERFAPLDAVFLTGAFIDDLDQDFDVQTTEIILVGLAIFAVVLVVAWMINRDITGPLGRLSGIMEALAGGNLDIRISDAGRRDEVGQMAKTLSVFKDNAREVARLKEEGEAAAARAERDKRAARNQLADAFRTTVGGIVETLTAATRKMEEAVKAMTTLAHRTNDQAIAVASASDEASVNVQSMASAAEELSASINAIRGQVASSSEMAVKAVGESKRTNEMVEEMASAAQKIEAVVELITDIASQTSLLALNATIEAARAGEAGKGFAVVANEVKTLSNQTAKATEEIAGQISAMQGVTEGAVGAIRAIGDTIGAFEGIASTISHAVEEQGSATQGIALNAQRAADGTTEVSRNIAGVSHTVEETNRAADDVLEVTAALAKQVETLRREVEHFLSQVRDA